jgi:hypothetical protein
VKRKEKNMFFEDSERDQAKVLSLIGTKDEKEKFKREVLMRKKIVNLLIEGKFTIDESKTTLKLVSDYIDRKCNEITLDSFQE